MPTLSEAAALAMLTRVQPITYDDLDDIFRAFGIDGSLSGGEVIWYSHPRYDVGLFRSYARYDFSTVPEAERDIAWRMIDRLRDLRELEE